MFEGKSRSFPRTALSGVEVGLELQARVSPSLWGACSAAQGAQPVSVAATPFVLLKSHREEADEPHSP